MTVFHGIIDLSRLYIWLIHLFGQLRALETERVGGRLTDGIAVERVPICVPHHHTAHTTRTCCMVHVHTHSHIHTYPVDP